jgi:hypothetical protein
LCETEKEKKRERERAQHLNLSGSPWRDVVLSPYSAARVPDVPLQFLEKLAKPLLQFGIDQASENEMSTCRDKTELIMMKIMKKKKSRNNQMPSREAWPCPCPSLAMTVPMAISSLF